MNAILPTSEDLTKLPLRAIVAYAVRTARRISFELRGVVAEHLMDELLCLVETALTTESIAGADKTLVLVAADHVAAAFTAAPVSVQSAEKALLIFSLVQASLTAMHAVLAVEDSKNARSHAKKAAECAQKTASPIKSLGNETALQAAQQDYASLVRAYGEHDDIVLGEPVHCFDTGK